MLLIRVQRGSNSTADKAQTAAGTDASTYSVKDSQAQTDRMGTAGLLSLLLQPSLFCELTYDCRGRWRVRDCACTDGLCRNGGARLISPALPLPPSPLSPSSSSSPSPSLPLPPSLPLHLSSKYQWLECPANTAPAHSAGRVYIRPIAYHSPLYTIFPFKHTKHTHMHTNTIHELGS